MRNAFKQLESINILNDFSAIDNNFNDETGLILWTKIPIYEISSGKKVWGTEPKESTEAAIPTMNISCLASTLNNDSIVDMIITLKNTSSTPIYLSNSELTYYYMNDNEYAQNVDIYYAGGRINGDWVSITDKVSAEATLLETKKDRANSKFKLSFSSINGALCYNESIDIKLHLSNQNWAQGIFNLENDYSYAGITDTDYIANNIIFTANYLNNNGEYAEYEYGEPIGDYHPTFSAFKIGEGSEEVNTLEDYNNFINDFSSNFGGIPFNEYATGDNISDNDPDSSLDDCNSPLDIWNTLNTMDKLIIAIPYCTNFGVKSSVPSHAIFIATINIPIGNTYCIMPNIPPNISFNFIPITPDFVYIKTAKRTLSTISVTIAMSRLDADFFFFLYLLFFAIFIHSLLNL